MDDKHGGGGMAATVPAPGARVRTPGPVGARGTAYGLPFGATERKDRWWLQPLVQGLALALLGAYATWAAFVGNHFEFGSYLSPFYSPLLRPKWWPLSPALLVLGAPLGFRGTCYYYRKAYYRAFFADPTACAVGEPRTGYLGEARFPFVLQNLHRYFLFLAVPVLYFLWTDVVRAFMFEGRFGAGIGSFAILASTTLLTLYTFSCHSLRHLLGGSMDCFSCAVAGGPRHELWKRTSWLNAHHMAWAWWSLLAVCAADFFVRFCSLGVLHDVRFF